MLKELQEEKNKRIFNLYKNNLIRLHKEHGQIRFNVIQYVCHFPKINPFKMASVLMTENYNVVFDDSSISEHENEKFYKKVLKYQETI